jgi:glycine/D-amino acid oxidase-like deaminating enzyme
MPSKRADVVVVGTGIVGAAIADRLSAEGLHVHVVGERLAGGATGAGMGHVLVLDEDPELFAFTRAGRARWHALAPELPASCEWNACGTLWVAENAAHREAAITMGRRLLGGEIAVDLVEARELESLEPALAPGLAGALRVSDDATIYQPAAARFLLRRAVARNGRVQLGQTVREVHEGSVELCDGSRVDCEQVVVAAGVATKELLGDRLPVELGPKKGQLLITERTHIQVRHHLVELGYTQSVGQSKGASVAFNVQPRSSGQLLVGSSRAYEGGRAFDRQLAARMLDRAFRFLPALRELAAVRAWTGLRCASSDGRPLIGPVGDSKTTFVASGHEGYGITTALSTGDLIAGWMGLAELPAYAQHYSPQSRRGEKACA